MGPRESAQGARYPRVQESLLDAQRTAEPHSGESVYEKSASNAFMGTSLEEDLRSRGIDTLVVAGLVTDHCVSSTARMASDLGFMVTVVSDACATHERIGHDGRAMTADRFAQKAQRRPAVAFGRQQKINRVAGLVDSSV